GLKKYGKAPLAIVNQKMETIVATGVILAGIPAVDTIDISKIDEGINLVVDGEKGTVEIVQ
ncbi:MAG: aconitase X swivel domain-containing protein, partial [Thermoplasmata archaeon]